MTRPDRLYTRRVILECLSYKTGRLAEDLVRDSGYSRNTIQSVISELRKERMVHIGEWEKRKNRNPDDGFQPRAMYMRGDSPDVPRPPRTPRAEVLRTHRARKKAKAEAEARKNSGHVFSNMFAQLGVAA